jgi:hypothetical protein
VYLTVKSRGVHLYFSGINRNIRQDGWSVNKQHDATLHDASRLGHGIRCHGITVSALGDRSPRAFQAWVFMCRQVTVVDT